MGRLFLLLLLSVMSATGCAQTDRYAPVSVAELLQYQRRKGASTTVRPPFAKYGADRIRAASVLADDDPRQLWGRSVGRNEEYLPARQPLYRLFRKTADDAVAFIDTTGGSLQMVFWDKRYYLRLTRGLRQLGFVELPNGRSNVLPFRRRDTTLRVDITVWNDMYVMEITVAPPSGQP